MNNGSMSFENIQKNNQIKVKRDFIKAIKDYRPEQAILIMGKHIPVEGKEGEYKYVMNSIENIVPERIDNCINALIWEINRIKKFKEKGLWIPPPS